MSEQQDFTPAEIQAMTSATAFDRAGARIGSVGDVYLDDATGRPAWVTVLTGLFGMKVHFAPLEGASVDGRRLVLAFTRDAVLAAPRLVEDEHLTGEEESVLFAHYGIERRDAEGADSTEPEPVPTGADPATASASEPLTDDLEAPLLRAEEATQEAIAAAEKADPLGDGSYAGDAGKAPLVDTPDLEAHADKAQRSDDFHPYPAPVQHGAAAAVHTPHAPAVPRSPLTAPSGTDLSASGTDDGLAGIDPDAPLPDGVAPADVLAAERRAEDDSEARRAAWEATRGEADWNVLTEK